MPINRENNKINQVEVLKFRGQILAWYDVHRRVLPWRALAGDVTDPYHVWLSEVMLQQTTVAAVKDYFLKFIGRWPDVQALANADNDEVMKAWAGLGYYARARNLHACAKVIADDTNGVFPQEQGALQALPGIGDYTSAAITSIAFDQPATVVDGNIERVMARYVAVMEPLPAAKKILKAHAHSFSGGQTHRPGDYAQALMDLGATICTPTSPKCTLCPVVQSCEAKGLGIAAELPKRLKKKPQPQKHGFVYWVKDGQGNILLHKRPDKGMLGGMIALPTSEWLEGEGTPECLEILSACEIKDHKVSIKHTFTHFDLTLKLFTCSVSEIKIPNDYIWHKEADINPSDFPTLFKKALKVFLVG